MLKSKRNKDEEHKFSGNVIIRGVNVDEGANTALKITAEVAACSLQPDDSVKQKKYHKKCSVITAELRGREKTTQFNKAAKKKTPCKCADMVASHYQFSLTHKLHEILSCYSNPRRSYKKLGVRFVWLAIDGEILIREKPKCSQYMYKECETNKRD